MSTTSRRIVTATVSTVLGLTLIESVMTVPDGAPLRLALAYAAAMSVLAAGAWWWWERTQSLRAPGIANSAIALVPSIIAAVLAVRIVEWQWISRVHSLPTLPLTATALVLGYIARPVAEEVLLRGWFAHEMYPATSFTQTVLASGFLSAIAAGSLSHAASGLMLGILLTMAVLRTATFWLAPLTHVALACLDQVAQSIGQRRGLSPPIEWIELLAMAAVAFVATAVFLRTLAPSRCHRERR